MAETYITTFPYACSCGQTYTQAAWEKLERVGVMHIPAEGTGPAETIELRNCVCGSTRAVYVVVTKAHQGQG